MFWEELWSVRCRLFESQSVWYNCYSGRFGAVLTLVLHNIAQHSRADQSRTPVRVEGRRRRRLIGLTHYTSLLTGDYWSSYKLNDKSEETMSNPSDTSVNHSAWATRTKLKWMNGSSSVDRTETTRITKLALGFKCEIYNAYIRIASHQTNKNDNELS